MDSAMRRAEVREYVIDDEALLFDPSREFLYYLNEAAFCIWQDCEGRTIREAALLLSGRYDVDPETALDHVQQIVGALTVGGLLTWEAADDARS